MTAVRNELNSFLKRRTGIEENIVELSELVNLDGSVAYAGQDKVLCTLISVEQERTNINRPMGGLGKMNPPIDINLYILFSAYYQATNYDEALKSLSSVIGFFQAKQVFTNSNTPGLNLGTEKLTVELINLDIKELSNFWTAVGSKHLPSVLYKWRMLSITQEMLLEELPEVTGVETGAGSKDYKKL